MDTQRIFELIETQIKECVPEIASRSVTREDSMSELGINSMERAEIIVATLEALDLVIPMTSLHGPKNLGELAELLHEKSTH